MTISTHRYSAATIAAVQQLVPMDDVLFQKICESKEVCQEIISTILDQEVEVIDVVPQDSIMNLQGRSVRLDCLCRLQSGVYVNVEVQKANDDDHEARVRYNAAIITANRTPKGARFEDVAQVIVIYITKFDIFEDGLPIYHIDRTVRETGKIRTDGFTEIYVNAAVKNHSDQLNSNVSELMDLFMDREQYNGEKFPAFSQRKRTFMETEKGEFTMCEVMEAYARERQHETFMTTLFEGVQDGGLRITYAAKRADLSINDFKNEMRIHGFTVPQRNTKSTSAIK